MTKPKPSSQKPKHQLQWGPDTHPLKSVTNGLQVTTAVHPELKWEPQEPDDNLQLPPAPRGVT